MAARMADISDARLDANVDVRRLAARWRRAAQQQRSAGNHRRGLFYDDAADALEAWADKVFAATTVWPGL